MKNIILIGMMGCGKSTIGKVLSKKIKYNFVDMDSYIEKISKQSIKELFEVSEDNFRNWESKACEQLSEKKGLIIACGGGVIKREINMSFLKRNGIVIYLDRNIESILNDIDTRRRPLLANGTEVLYKLKEEREALYIKYSDYIIKNNNGIKNSIDKIEKILR